MLRLEGRNTLITGASSGIGQAIAVRMARDGATVAINYRGGEMAAETLRMVRDASPLQGCRHMTVQADISREGEVQSMFQSRPCWPNWEPWTFW